MTRPSRRLTGLFLSVAVALSLSACGGGSGPPALRMGAIATGSAKAEQQRYAETARQLQKTLGDKVDLVTSTDYYAIAEALRAGRIDVAFLGSLSYVLTESRADIQPVAVGVDASGRPGYHSYLVTNRPDEIKGPADVRGRALALSSRLSTSGYLFPLDELRRVGVDPEKHTTLAQGGNHAANILAVAGGHVDAAFVESVEYESAVRSGRVDPRAVVKVWQSSRVTGSPVVVRTDLPEERRRAVTRALLNLRGSARFPIGPDKSLRLVPAEATDYDAIRALARRSGLSIENLRGR
ncbi:phosphate/phosphite/phosphonate ABC transporter substrate-binding protein [Thermomonospora umbrina]|uniref:Phosphonate transport system substrate-binding protein n=1 Tax=Thermomonospora umbrina TaxID=111806 RepID=A0A3D9T3W0_9ACTN|nr:phosphate/phosphite/phosphonate ABC transporter substrate-binding protein [Thermomonospora umbrina]REE99935.1 phosphonate transport system substrate-binding protein [Thermomonospora umbrina]